MAQLSLPDSGSTFASRLAAFTQPRNNVSSELVGLIKSVRMFSDDWGLAILVTEEGKEHRLTGRVGDLKEDSDYSITATPKNHPKYGDGFEVLASTPYVKLNEAALVKFIMNNYKGIGKVSAKKFVLETEKAEGQAGLSKLRDQLLHHPWTVDFSLVKKEGTFDGDEQDKTMHSFIQRGLATRINTLSSRVLSSLSDFLFVGIKTQANELASKATGKPGSKGDISDPVGKAWEMLSKNPYAPIESVEGYAFLSADSIARMVNLPKDAPVRLSALVSYAIMQKCSDTGHTFVTRQQAYAGISKVDPTIDPQVAINHALIASVIDYEDSFGVVCFYPKKLFSAETQLAERIALMCTQSFPLTKFPKAKELQDQIQSTAKSLGGAFKNGVDASQLNALMGILTSSSQLHTITAEPGSGKTAVMEILAKFLPDKKFLFCAPTGKGAKVLSNRVKSVGAFSTTIHSMLKGDPDGGFRFNQESPLEGDILVIDEGTMPDLRLAKAVFDAVPDGMHVIILGDIDQLPSIDPGSVLSDLLKIPEIDHHRLTSVHRNAGGILDVIREVKSGYINPVNRDGVRFSGGLASPEFEFNKVLSDYLSAVDRSGYKDVALLMSRRKGEPNEPGWNTTYANAILRDVCNPNAPKLPGSTLCVGDRVIIKSNMSLTDDDGSECRVVNGDTGSILGFSLKSGGVDKKERGVEKISVKLDDERTIMFPGDAISSIQLGYALTVHAAQGSEYKDVIAVITPGVSTFINRNMLYTGLSRARSTLSVYANDSDLKKIAATPMPARNSYLVDRINSFMDEMIEADDAGLRQMMLN